MDLARLVWRNLLRHPIRTLLTVGSLTVALFLMCTLRSLVTTLELGAEAVRSDRLWVQSAVSLFVDLPLSYPAKIEAVDGVERACKWQWFGGYYQDPANFFAQFAVDRRAMMEMYPEIEIVDGDVEDFYATRSACLIGEGLAKSFGWKVGDTIPITGALFPHPDGADVPWEFQVAAIYHPRTRNFDDRTLFFGWELFEETMKTTEQGVSGVGAIVLKVEDGTRPSAVMAAVDQLFDQGPQRVQTTTEAEFQAQFVSMFGNIPFFLQSIGGAVLLAILLACVNTMLMAAREQTHDIGILKALGFTDRTSFGLLVSEALSMCILGGGLGILVAVALEPALGAALGQFFPGYSIEPQTLGLAAATTLAIGLLSGLVPAVQAGRLRPVDALSDRE